MKLLITIGISVLLFISCTKNGSSSLPETLVTDTLNIRFVQSGEAASLLKTEDDVSNRWNQLDIAIRLNNQTGTKNDLLEFISQQTRDWQPLDMVRLLTSQGTINAVIREKGFRLHLPDEVRLLKSTMEEEVGAMGYTRTDYIVLSDKITQISVESQSETVSHEIFHVLTRNNPEFRKQMYGLIGFTILPREVEFPQELKDRLITNPDVIRNDSYATFIIGGKKTDCVMVIYSEKPYEGGSLNNYVNIGLVAINRDNCKAIEKDGKAVIYSITDAVDFYDQVGKNTSYVLDPEEILAENFCYMLMQSQSLPTPELIQKMEAVCK